MQTRWSSEGTSPEASEAEGKDGRTPTTVN